MSPRDQAHISILHVRKRGLATRDLVGALVRGGVVEWEIGVAGLKDRWAVT